MFLPDVGRAVPERMSSDRDDGEEAEGDSVSGVLRLIGYRPERTKHLERYTQAVMRGPSDLSAGQRELIAAFTSARNNCPF